MKSKLSQRLLAGILSVAMLLNMGITPGFAAIEGALPVGTSSVCTHHVHDEKCGYTEGTPCTHVHTDECYTEVTKCVHEHTAECYSGERICGLTEEVVDSGSSSDATHTHTQDCYKLACTHICDEKNGCITKELACKHVHDDTCGYKEGTPCTFDTATCEMCNPKDSGIVAKTITAFAPLAQSEYTLPIGADEATIANVLVFPKTIKATVNEAEIDLAITWESNKALSTEKADTFTYTAKLTDEGYTLAEGISLPTITVAVEEVMAVQTYVTAPLAATATGVLEKVYATDSGIKPDLAVTQASTDAYWKALPDGGIRTQTLQPDRINDTCHSINVRFALPEDAYYSTAFEVYTCSLPVEGTVGGTAGGYIMNYPAGNRAPADWGYWRLDLDAAKFPYAHKRVDPQDKWQSLTSEGQKGGTVTLMAGIASGTLKDDYDYANKIYIGFRNLKVNRLDTKVNVSTQAGGTFDVAVALEDSYNATKATSYNQTIGRGASVTVTAHPGAGYYFENWVDGSGKELSRSAQYTFESATSATDTSEKTVKAVFVKGTDSRVTIMLEAGAQNLLNEGNFSFYANDGWEFKESYDGKRGAFAEHNSVGGMGPQKRVLSYRINALEDGTLYATLICNRNSINVLIDGKPVETAQIPQGDNNTVYFHSPITKGEHIVTFDATVDNSNGHTFIYDVGIAKDVTITPAAATGILGCKSYTLNVNGVSQTLNGSAIKVPYNSLIEVEMVPEDSTSYTFKGWDTGSGAIKLVSIDGSTWQQNGRAKAIAKGDIAFTPVFEAALNVGVRFQRDAAEKAPNGSAYGWQNGADHGWTAGTLTPSAPFPETAPHKSIEFVYDRVTNPTASLSLPLTIPAGEPCMISFLAQNGAGFSIAKIAEDGSETIEYNRTLTVPSSGKCYFTVLNPGKYMLKWTGDSTATSVKLADFTCKKTSEWTIGKITTNVYTQTSIGVDTKVNDQLNIKALPSFIYPAKYAAMAYNNTIGTPQQVIFDISETANAKTYKLDTSALSMKLKDFKFKAQNTDTALSVADSSGAAMLDVSYQAFKMEKGGITLDIWLNDITGAPEVDTHTNTVYGNGTPLFICKNGNYNEIWTYNTTTQNKVELLHTVTSEPSATIYGGAKSGTLNVDTYIKTDAGSDLNNITLYGGNEEGQLNGSATIECNSVRGATINGGSKNGSFVGNSTITMLAKKSSTCNITAGNVQGDAAIIINGTVKGQVDGGAAKGKVNITVAETGSLTLDTLDPTKTQSIIGATANSQNAVEINIKQGANVEGEICGFANGITATNANVAINLSSNTGSKIYTGIYTGGAVNVNILKTYTKDIYVSKGKKAPQLTPELKGEGAYFVETTAAGYDQYKYTDTSKPFVDATEKTIYCNGIKTTIWQQKGSITIEYIVNGATKTLTSNGWLNEYTIYGGAKNTPVASTDVTVGSAVKTYAPKAIYGGGSGKGATVEGDTKLTLVNQNAKTSYGGGKDGDVNGNAVINLQDINYFDSVYTNTAYAGGEFGKVAGTATINYDTHMIGRMTEIYGLSDNAGADVGGEITVNLAGSATVKVYLPREKAQAVGPKGETDYNFIRISEGVSSSKSTRNPMMYEVQTKISTKTDDKNKVTLYANGYPLLITDDGCYFDLNQNSVADGGDKPCPTDNAYTIIYAGAEKDNVASVFLSIQSKNSSRLTVYADGNKGSVLGDVTLCVAGTVANDDVRRYSVSGNATFCLGSPTGGETFISGKVGYDLKSFKKLVVYQPFNCTILGFPEASTLEDNLDQSKYYVKREGTTCTTVDLLKPDDETIEVKDTFDGNNIYTGHLVAFYDKNNGSRIAFDKNRNGVYDSGVDEMCALHYNNMVIKGVGSTLTMQSWQTDGTTVTLWNGTSFTMNGGTLSNIKMEDTQLSNDVNIKLNDGTYSNISIKGYNSTGGDVHCQMNGGTWNISDNAMLIQNDSSNTQNPTIKIGAGVTLGGTGSLGIANNGKVSLDMSALQNPLAGGKSCYATGTNGCKGIVPPTGYDWGAAANNKYTLVKQTNPIPQFPVTAVCTEKTTLTLNGVKGAASLANTSTAIKATLSGSTVTIEGTSGPDYGVVTVYDSAGKTLAYIMITMEQKEVKVTVKGKITSPVGQKNAWDKAYFTLSVSGTGTEDELMLTAKNALTIGKYDLILNKTVSNNKCYHYTLTNGVGQLEKTALPTITAIPATMLGDSAGKDGWYRDFVWITPPAGYLISTEKDGVYTAKLIHRTSSPNTQAVKYFLKDNGSTSNTKGHTTDAMFINVKLSNETNFATLNSFATSNITDNSATVSGAIVTSGECGLDTLYILPVTGGAPTAAQVKAGTAMTVLGNSATANLNGLKGGTTYQLYVLPISQSGVCSQPSLIGEVTTMALETTVTVKPIASAVYGTALADITLSGGTVTAEGNANVVGTWAWTQASSNTILPNVGDKTAYEATFTPTDSMYKPITAQVTPVVAAKTVTVTPTSGQSIVYGATSGLTFTTSDSGAQTTGALALANANVGTQNITMGTLASSSANYTLVLNETTVTATVTQRPVVLSWTNSTGVIYNAAEQSVTATITNKVNSDDVTVSTYSGNTGTNVGTYHARALTLTGNAKGNYTLEGVSNAQTLTITAATPTVAVTAEKKVSRRLSLGNHEDTITLKATVTGVTGGTVPMGTVTFKSGATTIASNVNVTNGVATYEWVNPDAATYTITAEFAATADTNYGNATGTSTAFDIDKAEQKALNIINVPKSVTYGDGNFTLSTTGGSGTGVVTYTVTAGDAVSVVASTGAVTVMKAGTATITSTKAGDTNYNAKTDTVEITVQSAKPTVTWGTTEQSTTYTGSPVLASVLTAPAVTLVKGESYDSSKIQYAYKKTGSFSLFAGYTDGLPTAAGKYEIKAKIAAEGNYTQAETATALTLTIEKSTPTLAINTMNGKAYDGTAMANPTAADMTITGTKKYADVKFAYSKNNNMSSATINAPKDAGTYYVRANVLTDANTNPAISNIVSFTIAKAPLTIIGGTAKAKEWDNTTTATMTALTFGGLVKGETLAITTDYTVGSPAYNNANAGTDKTVTGTAALVSNAKTDNYALTGAYTITGQTISAKTLTGATVTVGGSYTYTGSAITPTAENVTVKDGTTTLTNGTDYGFEATDNTSVGMATVTVTFKGNYSGTAIKNFTIAKADPTYNIPTGLTAKYGETLSAANIGATMGFSWMDGTRNVGAAGTQTHKAKFTPDDLNNYNIVNDIDVTVTVEKATPTVAVNAEKKKVRLFSLGNHEDTITLKATITGVAGGTVPTGTITFKSGATTIASDVNVKNGVATYEWVNPNAATYTITAEFVATANTNYGNATGTSEAFDIDKVEQKALNIINVPKSVTYGDSNFTLSTTGGSGTGDITYTVSVGDAVSVMASTGAVTVLKAGTATITATKAGDTNYNAKTDTVAITVQSAKPTVTWGTTEQSTTYTGSPVLASVLTAPTVTLVKGETYDSSKIQYAYKKTGSFSLFAGYTDGLPTAAGKYEIKAKIAAEGNYTQAETATALTLTINKSTPSITINTMNDKTYDGTAMANPAVGNMTISGANYADVTFAYSKNSGMSNPLATAPKDAGTYYVRANVLTDANTNPAISNIVSFAIAKAPLTITGGTAKAKEWDNTTTATMTALTFNGLVKGETLAITTDYKIGSPVYNNANAGTDKTVTGTATLVSNAKTDNYTLTGAYTINGQTISKATGLAAPTDSAMDDKANTFAFTPATGYETANLYEYSMNGGTTWTDVTTNPISVGNVAGTIKIRIKATTNYEAGAVYTHSTAFTAILEGTVAITGTAAYGETLTATVSGTQSGAALKYQWKADNVEISGATASTLKVTSSAIGKAITVEVSATGYNGKLASSATSAVAKRTITVTAVDKSKTYGQTDPALTYTVTADGLINNDTLTGALTRTAGETANTYAITQGTLANAFYDITYAGANLTIGKASVALNVTVDPAAVKAGKTVTIKVDAKNAANGLMTSGWSQPSGVTLTGPDNAALTLTPVAGSSGEYTASYTVPASTAAGTQLTFTAAVADSTGNYTSPTNATGILNVTDKSAVKLTLQADKITGVTYGDTVTYTAKVEKYNPIIDTLDGTVSFYLGEVNASNLLAIKTIGSDTLAVTLDSTRLTAGSHTISAVYSGNSDFATATQSTNTTVAQKVLSWDVSGLSALKKADGTKTATIKGNLLLVGGIKGADLGFSYTGMTGEYDSAEAGERTVTVTVVGAVIANTNYAPPVGKPTFTGTINPVNALPTPPESGSGTDYKLEQEGGISMVPDALQSNSNLDTPAKIEAQMKLSVQNAMSGVDTANIEIYDMTLWLSTDGGITWTEVTEANFPASGITIVLPYPAGTDKDNFNFTITHMFTTGTKAGTTETITPTKTARGLEFKLYSLSPIAMGYKAVSTDNGGGNDGSSSATYYTITATAGAGGSISTGKYVSVPAGDSAGFTMTPDKGYIIANVKVNGNSVGAVKNYVFTNVHSNQTIEATFKASSGHINPQTGVAFEE